MKRKKRNELKRRTRGETRNRKEFNMAALKDQPEQRGAGRKCKICKRRLTIYNLGNTCLSRCDGEPDESYY